MEDGPPSGVAAVAVRGYDIVERIDAGTFWVIYRARQHGIEWDRRYLVSAEVNLHLGTSHLAALLRTYDGDVIPALAAYNAGGRPVARWLRYPEAKDPVRFVERIPYVETRGYLRAVLRNQSLYRGLYAEGKPAALGSR